MYVLYTLYIYRMEIIHIDAISSLMIRKNDLNNNIKKLSNVMNRCLLINLNIVVCNLITIVII